MNVKETATALIKQKYSVIPITETKNPAIEEWTPYQTNIMPLNIADKVFNNAYGLGFICGKVSGNVEAIDLDCKYDLTGTLYEDFTEAIRRSKPGLLETLVIASTRKKGYHFIYKCQIISGNNKLANRPTTPEEKEESYKKGLEKAKTAKAVLDGRFSPTEFALKEKEGDKVRVLIETRGEGGYIAAFPTPGYSFKQGSYDTIAEITTEDRNLLFSIARSFNQIIEEERKVSQLKKDYSNNDGVTPWEDYNRRGGADETLRLLESDGWQEVGRRSRGRIYVLRPGSTDSKTSGNIRESDGVLYVFTTSSEFNAEKGYSPFMVYYTLKHKGDASAAASQLYKEGYGERRKAPVNDKTTIKATVIKAEGLQFEITSTTGEILTLVGNEFTARDFNNAKEVLISVNHVNNVYNIINTISSLYTITSARIYVKDQAGNYRGYEFLLQTIHNKYAGIEKESGKDLSSEDQDRYEEEILQVGGLLKSHPVELAKYEKTVKEALNIPAETLKAVLKRLHSLHAKQEQLVALTTLQQEIGQMISRGDASEALDYLDQNVTSIRLKNSEAEFNELLRPITRDEIEAGLQVKTEGVKSGIVIVDHKTGEGEEILLPSGALTIIAAPSHHGKTTMLLNIALNDIHNVTGPVHFFSYEESNLAIIRNALNTYVDVQLSRGNRRNIDSYLAKEKDWKKFVSNEFKGNIGEFESKAEIFLNRFIETGKLKIHYKDFSIEELIAAIEYIVEMDRPAAVYIDYIQLLNSEKSKGKARHDELSTITKYLRHISVTHDLPIILAAQFNRKVTSPLKIATGNIGEGGDIERSANTILGMWGLRPALNLPSNAYANADPADKSLMDKSPLFSQTGQTYIKVLKHRLQSYLVELENTYIINPATDKIYTNNPVGYPVTKTNNWNGEQKEEVQKPAAAATLKEFWEE